MRSPLLTVSQAPSFKTVLTIDLVGLSLVVGKLTGLLDWSWVWVLTPWVVVLVWVTLTVARGR